MLRVTQNPQSPPWVTEAGVLVYTFDSRRQVREHHTIIVVPKLGHKLV